MTVVPATKVDRASVKDMKIFFEAGPNHTPDGLPKKVKLTEMTELKASNGGKDFDHIANGIGNGTLTY